MNIMNMCSHRFSVPLPSLREGSPEYIQDWDFVSGSKCHNQVSSVVTIYICGGGILRLRAHTGGRANPGFPLVILKKSRQPVRAYLDMSKCHARRSGNVYLVSEAKLQRVLPVFRSYYSKVSRIHFKHYSN